MFWDNQNVRTLLWLFDLEMSGLWLLYGFVCYMISKRFDFVQNASEFLNFLSSSIPTVDSVCWQWLSLVGARQWHSLVFLVVSLLKIVGSICPVLHVSVQVRRINWNKFIAIRLGWLVLYFLDFKGKFWCSPNNLRLQTDNLVWLDSSLNSSLSEIILVILIHVFLDHFIDGSQE